MRGIFKLLLSVVLLIKITFDINTYQVGNNSKDIDYTNEITETISMTSNILDITLLKMENNPTNPNTSDINIHLYVGLEIIAFVVLTGVLIYVKQTEK